MSHTVDLVSEIVIRRSRTEVASFAMDPNNAPAWYANIKSVEWRSDPPLRVGTRVAFVAQFLNRRLAYTYEVVELLGEQRMVMRTSEGPFPMETSYAWQAESVGVTRMTLRNRGTPSGFSRLVAPFMAMAIRRANRHDLARLKALLEVPNERRPPNRDA